MFALGLSLRFTSLLLSSVRGLSCWLLASVACLALTRDRGWCAGLPGGYFLTLSLCRRRLSGFSQSRPPDVVWFGNLQGYPGNVHILLAVRNPRGRHRPMSMGPDIANSRYQRWLYLGSRTVAVSCHPYMPRFVSLFAVGLRTFDLGGVAVCEFCRPMVSGHPVRVCVLRLVWVCSPCCLFVGGAGCVHRPGFPRV